MEVCDFSLKTVSRSFSYHGAPVFCTTKSPNDGSSLKRIKIVYKKTRNNTRTCTHENLEINVNLRPGITLCRVIPARTRT